MRLLRPLPRKENTKREKYWKLSCWNPYLGKYDRYTEKWQEADLPKSFSTGSSLSLFVGHTKGMNGLCPIAKFTKRGHNLFLPKMRRILARQLNHRNDSRKVCPIRKNKFFFGRTAHFVYLCINNKSCLKRQQIKEVRGIWVVTKS